MKIIKNLFILIIFSLILINCTTIKFGKEKKQYNKKEEVSQNIKEFDFSYYYKIFGISVTGNKAIVENVFGHPDKKIIFMLISFPKVGIIKTNDYGKTFASQFFENSFFNDYYEFNKKEENDKDQKEKIKTRIFSHFAVSPKNPDKVIISCGQYIFYSKDCGVKWNLKNIFFDGEKSNIKDIFVSDKEEIIILTENKIAYSFDWGNKWHIKYLKIPQISLLKTNYITGFYDNSSDTLFSSIKATDENDSELSQSTYDFLYKGKNSNNKSGLYFTKDFGKTWNKTSINIPVSLWKYKNQIYGSTIYPIEFYNRKFSEDFVNSPLFTENKLDNNTGNLEDFSSIILNSDIESYQLISLKTNKLIHFEDLSGKYSIIDENNFENIYYGLKKLEGIDYIQFEDNQLRQKKSNNFFYDYNPYRFFKNWTGMRINSPVKYVKSNDVYFRIKPQKEFLEIFNQFSIDNQIRINSIIPIMRRSGDVEFFDPAISLAGDFPVDIEYTNDSGKTWKKFITYEKNKEYIDGQKEKRSLLYWYKNVDSKKTIKFQINFGSTQTINLLVYPMDFLIFDKYLFINLNYFSLDKSYKDAYLVPLDQKYD